jgi:hypothetical protein
MALLIVSDYIGQARTLLQDTVQPYRYPDTSLVLAINNCWQEIARLRPDILINARYSASSGASGQTTTLDALVPTFSATNEGAAVPIPTQYAMSVLYYMVGFAQLTDNEDTQDARATALINKFVSQLITVMA